MQTNLQKSSSVVAQGGARVRRDSKEGMEQGVRTLWGNGLLGVCVRIVQLCALMCAIHCMSPAPRGRTEGGTAVGFMK